MSGGEKSPVMKHLIELDQTCDVAFLAGAGQIGIGGGNIIESGMRSLCTYYKGSFEEICETI